MSINLLFSKLNFDEEWARNIMEDVLEGCKKIVVLPFSYWDFEIYDEVSWEKAYGPEGKYFEEIYKPFSSYGFTKAQFRYIDYFTDSEDVIRKEISESDILFLTGGAPDLYMNRIKNRHLQECLEKYAGVVIGCSAGTMIQFKQFHITPGPFYPDFSMIQGIGMISLDMGVEVHFLGNDNQLNSIEKTKNEYAAILLLDNESGALITENDIQLLGNAVIINN